MRGGGGVRSHGGRRAAEVRASACLHREMVLSETVKQLELQTRTQARSARVEEGEFQDLYYREQHKNETPRAC